MEEFEIVGTRLVNFTDSNTGQPVSGLTIYVECSNDNVIGVMTDKLFLSPRVTAEYMPSVGDTIFINYNKYGKVSSISKSN